MSFRPLERVILVHFDRHYWLSNYAISFLPYLSILLILEYPKTHKQQKETYLGFL